MTKRTKILMIIDIIIFLILVVVLIFCARFQKKMQAENSDNNDSTIVAADTEGSDTESVLNSTESADIETNVGGQTEAVVETEGTEDGVDTEGIDFVPGETAVSCIIWPVSDLAAYSDADGSMKIGNVTTLKAYYVIDEADGMFAVELDGQTAYIDSTYCMINLPDYLGSLCLYDITNSYSSYYTIHDLSIPDVTWTVIEGYENVRRNNGTYLVPLLYPTAQKLLAAAQDAAERGYCIKIYDSYRPNKATRSIYDLTAAILDDVVPGEDITYRNVMISGSYKLSNFLAKNRSMHNLGIAMDLTLVDADTGEEIQMQTSMHDLSHFSAVSENNEAADLLAEIMTGAGFGTLSSEWWHFQDNDARDELDLPTLYEGVSAPEDMT